MDFERGVIITGEGYFVGAVKWQVGTPPPKLHGTLKAGKRPARIAGTDAAPGERLYLLVDPEALADPVFNGKWDFDAREWLHPTERVWIVNTRRDLPRYGSLAASRLVWPGRPLDLPDWQAVVTVEPPQSRARRPLWDFEAEEWITPKACVVLAADGETVENVIVKAALDGGDVEPVEVEDEAGQAGMVGPGCKITGGHAPRYAEFPVAVLREVLTERGLLDDFVAFLRAKGFEPSDLDEVRAISLSNKLLREFVTAQGFTMRQAYTALQRAAEDKVTARRDRIRQLSETG